MLRTYGDLPGLREGREVSFCRFLTEKKRKGEHSAPHISLILPKIRDRTRLVMNILPKIRDRTRLVMPHSSQRTGIERASLSLFYLRRTGRTMRRVALFLRKTGRTMRRVALLLRVYHRGVPKGVPQGCT